MSDGEPPPNRGGAVTYDGAVRWRYRPHRDERPDPGEVVWAWVSYAEDEGIGKDRPIAVVGLTRDDRLAAVMLSSRSRAGDDRWVSVGRGSWDAGGRESWARIDRLLAVHSSAVRREGAALPRDSFDRLVKALGGRRTRSPLRALLGLVRR